MAPKQTPTRVRSSVTGQFRPAGSAKQNPRETVVERVKPTRKTSK